MKYLFLSFFIILGLVLGPGQFIHAQPDTIDLRNPSFEDIPTCCDPPAGWKDCGFPGESPPDVQPSGEFHVTRPAHHGNTYLGMVARDNDTWEMVSQRLTAPIKGDKCYEFNLYLCRNDVYLSPINRDEDSVYSFTTPIKLRIWGGYHYCDKEEMLAETDLVKHTEWREYNFEFHPGNEYEFILLEAFYKTPSLFPYRGNILVDHASSIIQTNCPGAPPLIAAKEDKNDTDPPVQYEDPPSPPDNEQDDRRKKNKEASVKKEGNQKSLSPKKGKILTELDRETIRKGQIIRIDKLYFDADESKIDSSSFEVLNEMYYFLHKNQDVMVEIGGHTNGMPKQSYCDSLSKSRAKAVFDFLVEKGIDNDRMKYKGYGKRKPVASNKTAFGRKKNQRVELKILDMRESRGN